MSDDDAVYIAMSFALSLFLIVSILVCIKRRRQARAGRGQVFMAPVIVTSATHTAPGGYQTNATNAQSFQVQAPYPQQQFVAQYPPANMGMPMPQAQATMIVPMPQPMVGPGNVNMAPYPPAAVNPPSYDQVVDPAYSKQAAYNPNFPG